MPNRQGQFVLFWLLFSNPCFPQTAAEPTVNLPPTEPSKEVVRLSEILITTPKPDDRARVEEAYGKAQQVRAAIGRDGTFADIARADSQGPTAAQGGDLGCFAHGKLAPSLEELVSRLQVGDVSEVVRTKQGFVILEVTDRGASCADRYGPIDILTDTKGVNLNAYLQPVLAIIKKNWYNQIPEAARAPIRKKGKVTIRFRVMKDGKITDVQLSESSGDVALDRAAYGGVTASNPLQPLPSGFSCQFLTLQFRFYYNFDGIPRENGAGRVPCVTTLIRMGEEVEVTVSPASVQMMAGAKQQFSATVMGDVGSALSWTVEGSGCLASTCGIISGDGLYTAPPTPPNPPTITVRATLGTALGQTASATVTLVQSSPLH